MDASTIGLIAFGAVLLLLALRVPIAFALASVATIATFFIFAFRTGTFMPERAIRATTSMVFSNSFDLIHSYDLSMIPLFVALGHIAYRADITTKIYHAAKVWLTRLPGGVAMASVMGCGGFSAITGSSIACASTNARRSRRSRRDKEKAPRAIAGPACSGPSRLVPAPIRRASGRLRSRLRTA